MSPYMEETGKSNYDDRTKIYTDRSYVFSGLVVKKIYCNTKVIT